MTSPRNTEQEPTIWYGMYKKNWKGVISKGAFEHPAKFSRSLINQIYLHLFENGYIKKGDTVFDPFGGVALGSIDAANYGLQWIGVELEEFFRIIGHKNILFWIQEGWCVCGNDGARFLSILRDAVSQGAQRSNATAPTKDRAILFDGVSQPRLFIGEESQRRNEGQAAHADSLEQREALAGGDEGKTLAPREQWEPEGREERPLERREIDQARRVCRNSHQREEETGTSACDGVSSGEAPDTEGTRPSQKRRQNRQRSRQSGTPERVKSHAASQSPWPPATNQESAMPPLPDDSRDQVAGGSLTNRLLLDHLQARQAARSEQSLSVPSFCAVCGKMKVLLPVLLQGDSRNLRTILGQTTAPNAVVSSPPWLDQEPSHAQDDPRAFGEGGHAYQQASYGTSEGQLGKMPHGDVSALISSPPYADAGKPDARNLHFDDQIGPDGQTRRESSIARKQRDGVPDAYGPTPGNLGEMLVGEITAVVSSPPFLDQGRADTRPQGGMHTAIPHIKADGSPPGISFVGTTEGQLSALPPGDITAIVSSPPYADQDTGATRRSLTAYDHGETRSRDYGSTPGQLGNLPTTDGIVSSPPFMAASTGGGISAAMRGEGSYTVTTSLPTNCYQPSEQGTSTGNLATDKPETFWGAASEIVGACVALLKPGGVTAWVLKDYIQKGKRVPFCDQWRQLCESHGLVHVETIRAMLVEEMGTQETLFGGSEKIQIQKKSFFRRLYEKRPGAHTIDFEVVLVLMKP